MSHLIPVQLGQNDFVNQEYLVKALEKFGFVVDSYATPQWFKNYYGKLQHKAEVILTKNKNKKIFLSSDAGFIKNPDTGIYELICDSMDAHRFEASNLNKLYYKQKIEAEATAIAYKMNKGTPVFEWIDDDTYAIQFEEDLALAEVCY